MKQEPWIEAVHAGAMVTRLQDWACRNSGGPRWPAGAWESFACASTPGNELQQRSLLVLYTDLDEIGGWLAGSQVDDTAELEFLQVGSLWRRQGFGRRLLRHWLAEVFRKGATRALLEVRAGNDTAIALYTKIGFTTHAKRPRYYQNPEDDALLMQLDLP